MKSRAVLVLVSFVMVVLISGCASLSRTEQTTLRELKAYGIREMEIQKKHPAAAGALNLLPGFGNFYLAYDTDESSQWLFGFLNLLTWPLSIVWGVPQGAIDASTINKKETIYYYTYDRIGKQELENLKIEESQKHTSNIATPNNQSIPSNQDSPVLQVNQ